MACVFILCGLPFAGKTTLSKKLARDADLERVSIDEINGARGVGFDNALITSVDWDITYAESYRQLDMHLRAGRSVVYDAANFTHAERDKVRAVAEQSGSEAQVIYVTTSETLARQRWQHNRLTYERNDIRDDYFEIVVSQFEPPTPDENTVFYGTQEDTSA